MTTVADIISEIKLNFIHLFLCRFIFLVMNFVMIAKFRLKPKSISADCAFVDQLADVDFLVLNQVVRLGVSSIASLKVTLVRLLAGMCSKVSLQVLKSS